MYKLRCPKCKAAASLPLIYTHVTVKIGNDQAKQQPNVFCLACRHRWHSRLRFHPAF